MYFVALDVETAKNFRNICQIGIAVVDGLEIIDSKSWLVRPIKNEYDDKSIEVHHITPDMTENAQSFAEVWAEVCEYIEYCDFVVAHNAAFDFGQNILPQLKEADIDIPYFNICCSLRIAEQEKGYGNNCCKLESLHQYLNLGEYSPHDAEEDAIATAELFLYEMLMCGGISSPNELMEKYPTSYTNSLDFKISKAQPQKRTYKPSKTAKDFVKQEGLEQPDHPLYKKSFCITGTLCYERDVIVQHLIDLGATFKNSIVKTLDYIIIGEGGEGTTKHDKAIEFNSKGANIKIIDAETFYTMIER